ncbi:MAG: flippase-like domain-containing protein [Candidatus Moranbacteria bacterium]|nr:flippase-like domain-containing protein [Candidatus Moranbacteria bacterium]
MQKKKFFKFLIKLIVSLGLLAYIFHTTDWEVFLGYIKSMKVKYAFLYVIVYLIGILISSYKWKRLSVHRGIKGKLSRFFELYLSGTFINNFMPSFIGGDSYKAYQIGYEKKNYIEASSTVIVDRMTGFLAVSIFAVMFGFLNLSFIFRDKILLFIELAVVCGLIILFFLFKLRHNQRLRDLIKRFLPAKVSNLLKIFYEINRNKKSLLEAILWAMVFNLIGVAFCNFLLFQAFGLNISLFDYLSVIFLISLIASIPISINNIGVKEWAYVYFFGLFGVSQAGALSVVIISRFFQMLVSLTAVPSYFRDRKKVKKVKSR